MITYQTIVLAASIGLLPALFAFGFWLKKEKKNFDLNFLLTIFFWGVLTAIPASIFQIFKAENNDFLIAWILKHRLNFVNENFLYLLIVAFSEEISKGLGIFLALRSFLKNKFSVVTNNVGIVTGMIVGVAFGVTENGVYLATSLSEHLTTGNLIFIILLRFLLSTSAHIIYSGIFGGFLFKLLTATTFNKRLLNLFGLGVPILIHFLFNYSLTSLNFAWLIFPLLVVGIIILKFLNNVNKK